MAEPRFFMRANLTAGVPMALEADDARHASAVLRSRPGDPVTLIYESIAWDARFESVGSAGATATPLRPSEIQKGELPAEVVVVQSLTKGAKFDDVVEKAVELGATRIIPVVCARSEATPAKYKVSRWRRIARAAAMQSRRRIVPAVDEPISWSQAFEVWGPRRHVLVAFERAPVGTFSNSLARYINGMPLVIAVGPEGGLTDDEIEQAERFGANTVLLGPTILRTETAAAALLAAAAATLRWW